MSQAYRLVLASVLATSCLGNAFAQSFQGRLANNTPSNTCTVSGANRCASFFNPTLNITILNNWNFDFATYGEAQQRLASAGLAATGLSGWVLPTGNGAFAGGPDNEYRSIWNEVGSSYSGLQAQFSGVRDSFYWSRSPWQYGGADVWVFHPGDGLQAGVNISPQLTSLAVAVRPGDVATAVPEPQTYAMLSAGLGALALARRRFKTPLL